MPVLMLTRAGREIWSRLSLFHREHALTKALLDSYLIFHAGLDQRQHFEEVDAQV